MKPLAAICVQNGNIVFVTWGITEDIYNNAANRDQAEFTNIYRYLRSYITPLSDDITQNYGKRCVICTWVIIR